LSQASPAVITLCMSNPAGQRALVTRGAAEAAAALRLCGEIPVLLLSAEGAGGFLGARGWRALVARARSLAGGARFEDALCCGGAPGHALEALRAGCRIVVLDGACSAFAQVAAAAATVGATVLPARPPALDLRGLDLRKPGGQAILARWLAATPDDIRRGAG
jgi:hypothetical protein